MNITVRKHAPESDPLVPPAFTQSIACGVDSEAVASLAVTLALDDDESLIFAGVVVKIS